jgi:prolyl oligopeptidase
LVPISKTLKLQLNHHRIERLVAIASAVLLVSSAGCLAGLQGPTGPSHADSLIARAQLAQSVSEYWRRSLPQRPDLSFDLGLRPRLLPIHSAVSARRGLQLERDIGPLLDDLDTDALGPRDFMLWRALRTEVSRSAERAAFARLDLADLSLETGQLRRALALIRRHARNTDEDVNRYLFLVDRLASWFAELRSALDEKARRVPSNAVAERFALVLRQLRDGALLEYLALERGASAELSDERFAALKREQVELLGFRVIPAIDSLVAFLSVMHAAAPSSTLGLWQTPGGKEYYRYLLRASTGLDVDPERAHAAGLAQLRRLDSLLVVVRGRNRWNPDPRLLHDSLRALPKFNAELATLVRRVDSLVRGARQSETARWQTADTALVVRAATHAESVLYPDGVVLMVDVADSTPELVLTERWRSPAAQVELATRAYRWGWPGRAMQLADVARNEEVGPFLRLHPSLGYSAGWQEYAGALAGERGWYGDPLDAYAHLLHEAFSAAMLVVDTGVHYFGWTRRQAMSTLQPYTLFSAAELDTVLFEQIEANPGRGGVDALAAREMLALRAWMQRELGSSFDVDAWHREFLSVGPLDLSILGAHLEWWSWEQRRRRTSATEARPEALRHSRVMSVDAKPLAVLTCKDTSRLAAARETLPFEQTAIGPVVGDPRDVTAHRDLRLVHLGAYIARAREVRLHRAHFDVLS